MNQGTIQHKVISAFINKSYYLKVNNRIIFQIYNEFKIIQLLTHMVHNLV